MSDKLNLDEIEARAKAAAHLEQTHGDFQSGAVSALAADVLALLAQLAPARALLAELLDETGLKESYTAADGTLHPGATSTVKDVWRFLWGEGKAE